MKASRIWRKTIFVTVGTTSFDALIESVASDAFLHLVSRPECGGYTDVVVQYGRGAVVPFVDLPGSEVDDDDDATDADGGEGDGRAEGEIHRRVDLGGGRVLRCRAYRFLPSLRADMDAADLILSHAGAGSVMEALSSSSSTTSSSGTEGEGEEEAVAPTKKKLAVVINSALMDNHQTELAHALRDLGCLIVVQDPAALLPRGGVDRDDDDGGGDARALLRQIEAFRPMPFPAGDGDEFGRWMDEHMGFDVVADEGGGGGDDDDVKEKNA